MGLAVPVVEIDVAVAVVVDAVGATARLFGEIGLAVVVIVEAVAARTAGAARRADGRLGCIPKSRRPRRTPSVQAGNADQIGPLPSRIRRGRRGKAAVLHVERVLVVVVVARAVQFMEPKTTAARPRAPASATAHLLCDLPPQFSVLTAIPAAQSCGCLE